MVESPRQRVATQPTTTVDLAEVASAYVKHSGLGWRAIVYLSIALRPKQVDMAAERLSKLAGVGKPTLKRKIEAIRFKASQGWDAERITAEGQAPTLASYVQGKTKARTLPLVSFPHRLTKPVRDELQEQVLRVARVLKLKTYDEVFQFINSQIALATDEELVHAAGESK